MLDLDLAEEAAKYYANPYGFVLWAYDWGVGELTGFYPDDWQRNFLERLSGHIQDRGFNGVDPVAPIRMCVASGHGIGKGALTAWLVDWIMSTRPNCHGTITANTGPQLETKTWAEIRKWTRRCITGHWFDVTSGKGSMKMVHRSFPESWFCSAYTCREENSESFAGQHAADSTSFYIFDEGSAVPDIIYEVAEGGLSDGEPMLFMFGNPTRNVGYFREAFRKKANRFDTVQIDSRTCRFPNKEKIAQDIEDFGEDSDFVRVRVLGQFPHKATSQFIPSDVVESARKREAFSEIYDPLVMGVDVARFGDDATVLYCRKGRDAKTFPIRIFRGLDTVEVASRVMELIEELGEKNLFVDAVFVDGGGVGGGVIDRLRQLGMAPFEVNFGSKPHDVRKYANRRAELWALMRKWLSDGSIPDDDHFMEELIGPEYSFTNKEQLILERKDEMRARGVASPDKADALALTFAEPVYPATMEEYMDRVKTLGSDYDPLEAS